jgi:6-phosphogluconolactonase
MYQRIAESRAREIAWDKVHVWWGDERCVAWDHPDSNARMAGEAFLSRVAIPAANVHRVAVAGRTPEAAATEYERELRGFAGGGAPFDVVLLGLGTDGHTASLFPGAEALRENTRWVASTQAPPASPVRDRVTITFAAISASERAVFLVAGADKREMVRRCLEPARANQEQLPAGRVRARNGVEWIVDRAAVGDAHR